MTEWRFIPLTQGLSAMVDEADAPAALAFSWHVVPRKQTTRGWYARRMVRIEGKKTNIYLHRFLLGDPVGSLIDHRNGDGLDCRRSNLRKSNRSQNNANTPRPNLRSGFRGVHPTGHRWYAMIERAGIVHRLGTFSDPIEAAKAYDAAAIELFAEFAVLNFSHNLRRAA